MHYSKPCIAERMDEVKNSYEVADVAELGRAKHLILGIKLFTWLDWDMYIGAGFTTLIIDDIDESDE